ncbi:4-coumarate--CoA ligase-like 6 [Hibiscus syriacus]|uniref:4-coumarate--CoA ligase n=1 Tax=Hibiscus syriacus TaxID=106335 RepID=A0A6A2ZGI8_HIBSY|nr:4-coumarate--CoA ligase-like 6 [Hibiscus syriacus]
MASGLHHLDVSQGDVVLLLLPNSVHFPIIFLSVLYLGAVVCTMNPLSSMFEIKKQISHCSVRLAFTSLEKSEQVQNLGVHSIGVPENIDFDSENTGFAPFDKLIGGRFGKAPRPVIRQQDTDAIMYSSGTTGVSKGVVLSHGNLIAMIELFVKFEASQYTYPSSKNVYLAVVPIGETDRCYGVTHFPVVPPMLATLTRRAKGACENSLKSLNQICCGAAPTSRKIIDDFLQVLPHVDIIQDYGMTETTAVGTRSYNTQQFHKFSSIGLSAPNMQAQVVDWNSGSALPPGYCELWLRGPEIMQHRYLNNVEATTMTIDKDGWLRTGDIVVSMKMAPADLEAILISHPEILDAAVTAENDDVFGGIPVAFVVRKHGSQLTGDAVEYFLSKQVLINVQGWYLAFNRMISPFLTQRTKSKFVCAGEQEFIVVDAVTERSGGGLMNIALVKESNLESSRFDEEQWGMNRVRWWWQVGFLGFLLGAGNKVNGKDDDGEDGFVENRWISILSSPPSHNEKANTIIWL